MTFPLEVYKTREAQWIAALKVIRGGKSAGGSASTSS